MRALLVSAGLVSCLIAASAEAEVPPPVETSIEVAAPISDVWAAWTSEAGAQKFFAPKARIDARVGGAYEIYFLPGRPVGLQGSEGATILALEPEHRLLFSWNAPEEFGPLRQQLTVVEVVLTALDGARTRVILRQSAWGEGEDWRKVRDYFAHAWPVVLGRLGKAFQATPTSPRSRG